MSSTNGQFWTDQFLKADGTPYAGVRVFHYVAGNTTVNLDVYQNGNLTAPHNNPVVGDASGRVWFYGSGTYRLLVKTSTDDGNLTLYDWDPVELIHHTATLRAEDRGLSLPGASAAARGRLFGVTDGGGDLLSLWMQRTAAIWQQILTLPELSQMIELRKGSTIASSNSVTIPGDGNFFDISGTNNIQTFSSFGGSPVIYTRTLSALTFVHSAQLILQGGQNRTSLANQITTWLHLGAGVWMELDYTTPLLGDSFFIDGSVLVGNAQAAITDLSLPTAGRTLGHSGVVGQDPSWITGLLYHGPTAIGGGSTMSHEGNVTITTPQSLNGTHYYQTFTLNAGVTLSISPGAGNLVIYASDTITINGVINAKGGGQAASVTGTAQQGGAGGGNGGLGGAIIWNGFTRLAATASAGTPITGSGVLELWTPWESYGGSGGGNGENGGGFPGSGGNGGATVCLIAPSITLGNGSIIDCSGNNGTGGGNLSDGGGGGGGAGNLIMRTRVLSDNGCTYVLTGGAGGLNFSGGTGFAGASGVKQVFIYG